LKSIELKNVKYKYPTSSGWIIDDVSFSVEKGKLCAVIGENGSGKTTICHIIRALAPRFFKGELEGEVLIDEKNINEYSMGELAIKVGFIFQNPFTQISGVKETVFDEIAFGLENLGVDETLIGARVEKVIQLLNIGFLAEKNPYELSGGQKQRVAIASILVMDPDILVIDEPTSQLDPKGTQDIFDIIKLLKNQGKTIVLIEHKIELLAEIADQIIVLKGGKLLAEGDRTLLTDESLEEQGVTLPQYAKLCYALKKDGIPIDHIATVYDDTCKMLESVCKEGK